MIRHIIVVVAVGMAAGVVGLLTAAQPAAALTATLTANPARYAGSCPAFIRVLGTIYGPANFTITYGFDRRFQASGNQSFTTAPVSAVIGANGQLQVSDTLQVDVEHSGSNTDQLYITRPQGYLSPSVSYSVTCQGRGGTPAPALPRIPPVFGLTSTNDATTCTQHADNVSCGFGIQQGDLVLIFGWSGSPAAEGYRAYRVDGGRHTLVYQNKQGPSSTVAFLDKPSDGFNGKCYVVTAYLGAAESSPSAPLCVGSATAVGIQTMSIAPSQQMWFLADAGGSTGVAGSEDRPYYEGPQNPANGLSFVSNFWADPGNHHSWCAGDSVCVGFIYQTAKLGAGDLYANAWNRGGILFDMSSARGRNIWNATLTMQLADTHTGGDGHSAYGLNCVARIETATAPWWPAAAWINGDDSHPLPFHQGGGSGSGIFGAANVITLNVTGIAHRWASGASPNNGFVLIGPTEDPTAFTENSCETGLRSIQLVLQFTS